MSATVNTRIQSKRDSTANWNAARGFVPLVGEVIIYNDYKTIQKEIDGEMQEVLVPGIKVNIRKGDIFKANGWKVIAFNERCNW